MSADHRKPVVAFVVLAFLAAALVGVQRADAQAGRIMAAVLGGDGHAQGPVLAASERSGPSALPGEFTLTSHGPVTSATPEATPVRTAQVQISRGHVRGGLAVDPDRKSTRAGASFPHGPADRAAEQAHAAVAKLTPGHAVAGGRRGDEGGRRPESSRWTR